jgi:hypothetical protein
MSIQKTFETFRIAEAKGDIKKGTAARVSVAALLEASAAAFHKAYWGIADYARAAESISKDEKQGEELVGTLTESMLSDLGRTHSILREAHATTDFPIILQSLRTRALRDDYSPSDSILPSLAEPRPTTDFKTLKGVKIGGIQDLTEQAEGESVDYVTFDYTEDSYSITLMSLAVRFTYQMYKNDDIGLLIRGMKALGESARRNRALACAKALLELPQITLPTVGVGGPDAARIAAAFQYQADRTGTVAGATRPQPRLLNRLVVGPTWTMTAKTALESRELYSTGDKVAKNNPAFGLAQLDTDLILGEILGKDWVGFDRNVKFLELAVLDDFAAGPRTITKLPDQVSDPKFGDFDDMTSAVKVMDASGAKLISAADAIRVKGQA